MARSRSEFDFTEPIRNDDCLSGWSARLFFDFQYLDLIDDDDLLNYSRLELELFLGCGNDRLDQKDARVCKAGTSPPTTPLQPPGKRETPETTAAHAADYTLTFVRDRRRHEPGGNREGKGRWIWNHRKWKTDLRSRFSISFSYETRG